MKKVKRVLSALLVASNVATMPLCASAQMYDYAAAGFCVASSESSNDIRFSATHGPGAVVTADNAVFDKLLVYSGRPGDYENGYTCFGSSTGPETLTLGISPSPRIDGVELFSDDYSIKALQIAVANQIQYIKSVGGVMTGYSIVEDDFAVTGKALNISWNVGGMHHFARFELCFNSRYIIGYYDLMYDDSSNIDIKSMNDSFRVLAHCAQ